MKHQDVFQNYLLISPSIWWNRSELLSDDNAITSINNVNVFIVVGSDESGMLKRPISKLVDLLNSEKHKQINCVYKEYGDTNHHSVLSPAIYDGIENLYAKNTE